ncbi:Myc-type, basic helix-loop-helix (bHLH) domain-containing protein [Artemisia annua]|uniref:Myc-type, basic helix-loop-helix (BHLH) domain-containing protein n=1 Tax=Artemisia annua TaxID=35608 RepID=A0A2U1QL39_ARTAN|nr:Myc-type, basic helix-loop-helix (bHLH) domain-containing protein [Artemisia annua]
MHRRTQLGVNDSWGKLRQTARDHLVMEIGDGNKASMWFDLAQIKTVNLDNGKSDVLKWKNRKGKLGKFTVSHGYNDLREDETDANWYKLVWFSQNIPQHAFVLWLAVQNKLTTQDVIKRWGSYDMMLKMGIREINLSWEGIVNKMADWGRRNLGWGHRNLGWVGSGVGRRLFAGEVQEYEEDELSTARTHRNDLKDTSDSCSSRLVKSRLALSSFSHKSSGSSERKREKMRKMVNTIREIVPSGKQMNSVAVIDEAVKYLKSLKVELQEVGVGI